jgi:hypothetical protein
MTSCYAFPTPFHVAELLSRWLATLVTVREQRRPSRIPPPVAVAVYVGEGEAVVACILCDWIAANSLGRADKLPAPAVGERFDSEEEDLLPRPICGCVAENLHKVMEACVNLFTDPRSPPLKLHEVLLPSSHLLSEKVADSIREASDRLHVQIEVPHYGRGHLTLVVV